MQPAPQPCGGPNPPRVVGLALKKEKRKKHISDKLVQLAAEAGITLKFIDKEFPVEQQGPFTAVLQKVRKPEWERELVAYAARHPEVQVYDMPAATYPLRNRGTMISFLDGDGWVFEEPAAAVVEPGRGPQRCRCRVPTNTTLAAGCSYQEAVQQMEEAGLQYPLLVKPLWADGREGSHALAVVHTPRGLQRLLAGEAAFLQLPVLLQQYVDHGGCLFKVYVMGDKSVRVKRNSLHLPQWSQGCTPAAAAAAAGEAAGGAVAGAAAAAGHQLQPSQSAAAAAPPAPDGPAGCGAAGGESAAAGSEQAAAEAAGSEQAAGSKQAAAAAAAAEMLPDLELMDRVSAYPASKSWGRADTAPKGHGVPSPPAWLLQALAQRLRRKTGLSLFNFDVIVPMHLHQRLAQQQQQQQEVPARAEQQQRGAATAAAAAVVAAGQQQNGGSLAGELQPQAGMQAAAEVLRKSAAGAATGAAAEEPACIDLRVAAAAEASGNGMAAGEGPAALPRQLAAAPAAAPEVVQQQQQRQQQQAGQQREQQQEAEDEKLYHLIDINYFPGYEKMPNYEEYMVQFLRSICYPQPQQARQTQ